jgi:hypothetical protein
VLVTDPSGPCSRDLIQPPRSTSSVQRMSAYFHILPCCFRTLAFAK